MPYLEMDTVVGRISLDEYVQNGSGFQALSGLTGVGLPPLESDWLAGAGDGSRFRYSRVQHRDIDLPLWLHASDRAGLKALVSKFSLALSGAITLRWVDGTQVWTLSCRRVGGGGIVYGEDTTGELDFRTVVTLRAGNPYWESTAVETKTLAVGNVSLANTGDAPAYPTWKINGPATAFSVTNEQGQKISWTGSLTSGEHVLIDAGAGTCKTNAGLNVYNQLGHAPKFFRIPPGSSTVTVTKTGTGAASVSWNPKKWMVI